MLRVKASTASSSSSSGIGFVGLLTIVFIVLKLTGYIQWSWFWVLSPMIISTGLVLAIVAFFLIMAVIVKLLPD